MSTPSFASLTTLRVGGTPADIVECTTAEALAATVARLDAAGTPLIIVGGGSNLLVAEGALDLTAVLVRNTGISLVDDITLRIQAGTVWDNVVAFAVEHGLGGIEALSGIPGSAGATPVQNVGAYGSEIADVLTRVRLYNRETETDEWVPASSLDLAYRYSNLKFTSRAVVLEIELELEKTEQSIPLRHLGGERVSLAEARESVLETRRAKGMVLDSADHDTWSAGSFFTNPVVPAALADDIEAIVGEDRMPRFAAGDGQVKLSAAWLIERAGCHRGFPGEDAPARLSTKHTLALTNRGAATADDIAALARRVQGVVEKQFGVELHPEPVWVGL
ncbi:UDP-N-acetylmuramate dehydrogenase [Corynebacterium lujinxingii]|uniref:UDP-N-acetylenolpyruvoylglucosamine reductase n=1 Tax=Corynebacterium lujinxingii TaxID=2763010 RepID=A0A7H0JZE9_9CORY|nr:UDP-N-acetylmuramate dehydrogenase [Corynebacterium lujinxingii]MBC3179587.1 UDP-N-acetylmuramate dehydrogenase [Corynebacterium lujinxingii]NNO10280.1 UDP-N-acetylmuramate dehydrogenase [Corynebacterium lujinxingii]QNP90415.1 UDP-N-acetylmuramate dehydrogenase [Corynebacterium lujinxingii]